MSEQVTHHHQYLRIKNFKRLEDLEVKDMGLFNLVIGDNNVGKTSLLEALMWHRNYDLDTCVLYLMAALKFRNSSPDKGLFWKYFSNIENPGSFSFIDDNAADPHRFVEEGKDGYRVESTSAFDGISSKLPVEERLCPFLPFQRGYGKEIAEFYLDEIQVNKKSKKLYIKNLKRLFQDIEGIERGKSEDLIIYRESSNYAIPLEFFGEGTINAIKTLSYIMLYANQRLMVDQIDTGIYFHRMKGYWKVMLQSALENNTQLFATTHNEECIKSYLEALRELGEAFQEKARVISLVEHRETKKVSSITFSFESFEYAMLAGNEIR